MNRRVLIFPAPFQGHVTPMMNLANLLHYKGFSITVIQSTYNALNPTNFPYFTFQLMEDGLSEAYSKFPPPDSFKVLADMNATCTEPFRKCVSLILKHSNDSDQDSVSCLIADPMWMFAGNVADSFNLPRIVLRSGGLSTYVVYDSLHSLREKGYFPLNETKLDKPVSEFPPLRIKDLPAETHHELLTSILRETKTSQGMICNTFEELEDQTLSIPTFLIGPIHKYLPPSNLSIYKEDPTSISWLNTKSPNSVLYVSFGSVASITEPEFLEAAWGLANSNQHFLWVIRSGLIEGSNGDYILPEEFYNIVGERGHIVKWAPQVRVLTHPAIGGFWSHSGWNSTLENICEGVPMLCLPFFGDQSMNARYVSEKWKIGLMLKRGVNRDEIKMAIRRLMVEDEGVMMRSRSTALKVKADRSIMEGHSSYKCLDRLTSYLLAL